MDRKGIVSSREIGKRIKCRRRELSLTQEALATLLDVSYQQVQRYESGRDRVNIEKLQAIAHALSTPISHFISVNGCKDVQTADHRESELISHFRNAQCNEVKDLIVSFAVMAAGWEQNWNRHDSTPVHATLAFTTKDSSGAL